MQYIILDGKTPVHGFKDGVGTYTKEEVADFDNVAVIVPKGYVVLDFDTQTDAEIMLKIIEGLDLKCRVMKTTRGIHCWFRSPEESPKNFIKNRLAVGIYCDRKSGGRNAYVKIRSDGNDRPWIRTVATKEIQVLPKWLTSVSAPSGKFDFKGMSEGSGRNQELFNYIVYLQAKGFTRDEIRETIPIINEYVFSDPLPDSEIATICRDEAFKPDEAVKEEQDKKKTERKFKHQDIGEELTEKYRLFAYNGVVYEYRDGFYQEAEFLDRYIRETYFGATAKQVYEVREYIKAMKKIPRDSIKVDPYILNLENTRLNVQTEECLPFDPEIKEFDRLPVKYDPSAYCPDLDKMLNRVFLGDREVIDLFYEMIGSILIKHNRFQKAFLLYGAGSNGKSTILELIKKFLGPGNYSTISLSQVTARFSTAELEHKLANIGDDIDDQIIRDTGTLKKIFSGDSLTVERKGDRPFTLTPYATHIYSGNVIPKSFDKSTGFYRRWMIIPFNAVIAPGSEDYDPLILDKITTDEALSYLLKQGLRGAKRLLHNKKFTEPQSVKYALEEYKTVNSSVLSWIDDENLDDTYLLSKPRDVLYSEFADWCRTSNVKNATGRISFYKEVAQKFDFEVKQKKDGKRYFMIKL